MISILREFTKSPIFTLLMALLICSFAVFGLRDVFSQVGDDVVIAAGKRQMDAGEFKKRFDNYKQSAAQQGQVINNEDFVNAGQDVAMINILAKQQAFAAWLDKLGVKPSAKLVVDEIAKIPYFFNAVSGKFDKDQYRQALLRMGITEAEYEAEASDQLATAQYMDSAMAGLKAPRIYAASQAALMLQSRDASFFFLSPKNVTNPAKPTDAEIDAFYKEKSSLLMRPEVRQASVIQFTPAQFASAIPVNEDDLKKAYQFRLDSLGTPETRTFLEVTAPDAASAAKISDALKSGTDPEAAAKANKGAVIAFDDKPKTAVPDAKIATAAFALKTGDVSGPIQGDLGYAVVRMGDIKIGSIPTYEAARPQLLAEYQQDKAATKLNDVVNEFQKAHDAGEDFDVTAKRLGLKVEQIDPLSADGKVFDKDGAPVTDPRTGQQADFSKTMPPQVLKDIFELTQGGTSDVEELGNNTYIALRLDAVRPAGLPPMDDKLKAALTGAWMQEKMAAAVAAKADEVMQRLNNGEAFAKVAADLNAPIQTVPGLDQNTGTKKVGEQVLNRVFSANIGENFQAPVSAFAMAIGHVDAVHQGDPALANSSVSAIRGQLTQTIGRDVQDMTQTGAMAAVKVRTFPAVADRALDVTPAKAKGGKAVASKAAP